VTSTRAVAEQAVSPATKESPAGGGALTSTVTSSPERETCTCAPSGALRRASARAPPSASPRASSRTATRAASTHCTWSTPHDRGARQIARTDTSAGRVRASSAVTTPASPPALADAEGLEDDTAQPRLDLAGLHDRQQDDREGARSQRADGVLGGGHPGLAG